MEKDDEISGSGNAYTTHFRGYDARLGRWLSVDPEVDEQPYQSPYCAMDNNPIKNTDPLGNCVTCDFFSGVVNGIAEGISGTIDAVANTVAHPIETAKGIGNAIVNYEQTYNKIKGAVVNAADKLANGSAYEKGQVVGGLLEAVGEAFVGAELVKAGTTAIKTAKAEAVIAKTAATTEKTQKYIPKDDAGNLLKTTKTKAGNTKIDAEAKGTAHTQLRQDASGNYAQRTTFDAKGRKRSDTHHTTHGEAGKKDPHKHTYHKNGSRAKGNTGD